MKITLAQLNPTVADIEGNVEKIKNILAKYDSNTDLIVFSELFLTGYPPRDLLESSDFIKRVNSAIKQIVEFSSKKQAAIIVGVPLPTLKNTYKPLYNSAILIYNGKILFQINKSLLPAYDIFDEERYFSDSGEVQTIKFKDEVLGISICEDMCAETEESFNPIQILADKGATILINISASPFYAGKPLERYEILKKYSMKHHIGFIFVNQVGANDELIFDGTSMFIDKNGNCVKILSLFEEEIYTVDTKSRRIADFVPCAKIKSIYNALIIGVRDYMNKCNFSKAVIGLSGGMDSALTAKIAVDAIGSENVIAVSMPSPYTTNESIEYANELSENLNIRLLTIPISDIYESYKETLNDELKLKDEINITLQNIQARIRGNILMSLSNTYGYLVLSTGNKSELSVGYSTLYGDLAGGLAVISDVPKTLVYEIADYINKDKEIIPFNIIKRAPTAELKPNQLDKDTLPPYDILDEILFYYIEKNLSAADIYKKGFNKEEVNWVIKSVNKNEYKRRQAPLGLRVTTKAFGIGRRMPVAAKLT